MSEYIIVNKTAIQKRIEELIKEANKGKNIPSVNSQMAESLIKFKEQILSQSTPLNNKIDHRWDCENSPTGKCDYQQEDGTYDEDCCRYCGEPEERK